jgi:hypothetical protein
MELLGAWQEKTSSAKYATAPKPKALNSALNAEFPCETTKQGPISYGYCQYISGKP